MLDLSRLVLKVLLLSTFPNGCFQDDSTPENLTRT